MTRASRSKLTLTISEELLKNAKVVSKEKGIPLSRLVERYFEFLVQRPVNCFSCGERFEASRTRVHGKCGWLVCPKCGACGCKLGEKEASVALSLRKTLEDLVGGRVGS
jgi:Family of unknown function (DUF6364)